MTTFQLLVQVDGETRAFITGAEDYGQAVHSVEAFLKAGGLDGTIQKVAPKRSITFVPPLNGQPGAEANGEAESTSDDDLLSF
jgi:hypothetical protein